MCADVSGNRAQCGDLFEQLLAVRSVGVIGLVVTEEVPDGRDACLGVGSVNMNGDCFLLGGRKGTDKQDEQQDSFHSGTDCTNLSDWNPVLRDDSMQR